MANENIQELKFQVGEAWKGVYSPSTAYGLANVVQDPTGLSIYRSLKSGNVGHPLSNASWWFRIIDLSSIKAESDRIAALNQTITQDEALRVAAEELRQQHEAERVAAETQRNEAEQQRISAEQARVNAESARATAEQQRITAEQGRMSAESARVQAEQARALAETLRANAEDARAANEQNRVAAEQQRIERAEQDHQRAESDHATYVDSLGAFDISSYHATDGVLAKYADLTAALGTGGANIPDDLRKGGMSVKFVQSSDNKYIQYTLKNNTWSIDVNDWYCNYVNVSQDLKTGADTISIGNIVCNLQGDGRANDRRNAINLPTDIMTDVVGTSFSGLLHLNGAIDDYFSAYSGKYATAAEDSIIYYSGNSGNYGHVQAVAMIKNGTKVVHYETEGERTTGVVLSGYLFVAKGETYYVNSRWGKTLKIISLTKALPYIKVDINTPNGKKSRLSIGERQYDFANGNTFARIDAESDKWIAVAEQYIQMSIESFDDANYTIGCNISRYGTFIRVFRVVNGTPTAFTINCPHDLPVAEDYGMEYGESEQPDYIVRYKINWYQLYTLIYSKSYDTYGTGNLQLNNISIGKKWMKQSDIVAGEGIDVNISGKNVTITNTGSLVDGGVTTSKIADGAVTNSKIGTGAVDETKFGNTVLPYLQARLPQAESITNNPDNITIESVNNVLKLKDYAYSGSGLGYVLISSPITIDGIASQIAWKNCIVDIRAEVTISGDTVGINDDSVIVLLFNGGTLKFNGGKWGNKNTIIDAKPYQIITGDIGFLTGGSFLADIGYGEWFGAIGDGTNYDAQAFNLLFSCVKCNEVHLLPKTYNIENTIEVSQRLVGCEGGKLQRNMEFIDIPITSAVDSSSMVDASSIQVVVDTTSEYYSTMKVGMGVNIISRIGDTRKREGRVRKIISIDGANVICSGGSFGGVTFAENKASLVSGYPLINLQYGASVDSVEFDGGLEEPTSYTIDSYGSVFPVGNVTFPYNRVWWEFDHTIGNHYYPKNTRVSNCKIYNSLADAIMLGGKNTIIEHNLVLHCGGNGIHLTGLYGCEISNNYIFDCNINSYAEHNEGAITYSDSIGNIFIHNNIFDTCKACIGGINSVGNCKSIITNNLFANFRTIGIQCSLTSGDSNKLYKDFIIDGNRFIGSQDDIDSWETGYQFTPYIPRRETIYGIGVLMDVSNASTSNYENIIICNNLFRDCGISVKQCLIGIVSNNSFVSKHAFTSTTKLVTSVLLFDTSKVNAVGNIMEVTSSHITKLVAVTNGKINLSNTMYKASVDLVDSGDNVNENNNLSFS